jgi:hypothetical protein
MTEFSLPEIDKIGVKLYISSASQLGSLDLSSLTAIGTLELVGCLQLNSITSPKKIGNIIVNYATNATCPTPAFNGLDTVAGQLSLTNADQTDNFNVAHIKHIGTFTFNSAKAGSTLTLPAVEKIGTMTISTYKLAALSAPALTTVENLTWQNVWSLATINLPALKTVTNFTLSEHAAYTSSNARMTNLDAFSSITSIGKVTISYCNKLVDFCGLKNALPASADNWSVANCSYNPTYQQMTEGGGCKQ